MEALPRDDAVEVVGVATFSASGYTREAALIALARLRHPRAIPYVLLRLADWVPEVRAAAVRCLRSLPDAGIERTLIEHHALIDHLLRAGRVDLRAVHAEILTFLRAPAARAAIEEALEARDASTRRFVCRVLFDDETTRAQAIERAVRDRDVSARRLVSRHVVRGELKAPIELLRALVMDRCGSISSSIIRVLTDDQKARLRSELLALAVAADSAGVREAAQFALRPMGRAEFAAEARTRILAAPPDRTAGGPIACLGQAGGPDDFDIVARFLDHPYARVRAAATYAVGRLDPARAVGLAIRLLEDGSGRVRRTAIAVLAEAHPSLWAREARTILRTGAEPSKSSALSLLALQFRWDSLPPIFEAICMDSETLRARAWRYLVAWHWRNAACGWIRPSDECTRELLDVWPRASGTADVPASARRQWFEVGKLIADVTRAPYGTP